ncbi:hypothetical protein AB9128_23610 [Streptomyces cinereoruber]|uniref:hypothetical protein n=1 Tax=Streptomyces cinereoruber TaxID=67260 RepID=UPI003EBA251C
MDIREGDGTVFLQDGIGTVIVLRDRAVPAEAESVHEAAYLRPSRAVTCAGTSEKFGIFTAILMSGGAIGLILGGARRREGGPGVAGGSYVGEGRSIRGGRGVR